MKLKPISLLKKKNYQSSNNGYDDYPYWLLIPLLVAVYVALVL
jgi:hypothetical protein